MRAETVAKKQSAQKAMNTKPGIFPKGESVGVAQSANRWIPTKDAPTGFFTPEMEADLNAFGESAFQFYLDHPEKFKDQ